MTKNLNRILISLLFLGFIFCSSAQEKKYSIVIHGGAGAIKKEFMDPVKEKAYIQKLDEALSTGEKMLKEGAKGIDVVIKVIQIMEDSPLFNAGKGAVFTHDGKVELDASIMDGQNLKAGAVAEITDVKSPIELAYRVMIHSPHVMLAGKGASEFAKEEGLTMVKNSYFYTDDRYKSLKKTLENDKKAKQESSDKHGTVGCVVLDTYGNLAAGTSTGGMNNKRYGRIGDSPIIGAGTYANNSTCAISCTGHGEYFIRYVVAYSVSALMEYKGMTLLQAADYMINNKLVEAGGTGGLIAIDKNGNIATPFNTDGMFRGFVKSNGEKEIAIYRN